MKSIFLLFFKPQPIVLEIISDTKGDINENIAYLRLAFREKNRRYRQNAGAEAGA